MFVFDDAELKTVDVEITLKGGSFMLTLTPPSLEARAVDDAQSYEHYTTKGKQCTDAYKNRFFSRLGSVTGWSGVTDPKGEPVEFSPARLKTLLGKNSVIIDQLGPHLAELFLSQDASVGESVASQNDSPKESPSDEYPPSAPI